MISFIFASLYSEFLFLIVLPFIVWVISWWGFISGKFELGGDAFLYYWDGRYFLDNISKGIYPLWNPDYSGGVPWHFFLRRIGEFNPFYWIISGLKMLGVSPLHAYLAFNVIYFFLGLVGFWLLARLFLKDRLASTGAYLLMLFSWGGQIFYCFDVLMMAPLTWYFYFLLAFAKERKKHQFLGACFSLALMITTYIPFFTITIISIFFLFLFIFFMKETVSFLKATLRFIQVNKTFAVLSLAFLLLACAPAVNFFIESKTGGFVLPSRHLGSSDTSQIAVSGDTKGGLSSIGIPRIVWDMVAYGYFDKVFTNQQNLSIGDFSIAFPFFIILILAIINPLSRRTALLLVSAVVITLSVTTKGHLYPFLMKHVFFFAYMRMLQLFFWLSVLPMLILMVMEQLRVFLHDHYGRRNIKVLVFVILVHVLFMGMLLMQKLIVWGSYLAVAMSLIFFIMCLLGRWKKDVLAIIFWLSLIIQPVVVAAYINHHCVETAKTCVNDYASRYVGNFSLLPQSYIAKMRQNYHQDHEADKIDIGGYYENSWIYKAKQDIYKNKIDAFIVNHLVFYDNTKPEDTSGMVFVKLSRIWDNFQNLAYLPQQASQPDDFRILSPMSKQAQVVFDGDPELKVLSYDANTLKLQTHLNRTRFLLWTNGYHPDWHLYIDGQEGRLLRADYAFKGAWIPAGDHQVTFRFGTPLRYVLAYVQLIAFMLALISVFLLGIKEKFLIEKEVVLGNT